MKRRHFLILSGGSVVALAGAGLGVHFWQSGRPVVLRDLLGEVAESLAGAGPVGRARLAAGVDGSAAEALARRIGRGLPEMLTRAELAAALGERVEADLVEGEWFRHDGWLLAETEALLAALHVERLGDEAHEAREPGFEQAREGRVASVRGFAPESMRAGENMTHPQLPDNVMGIVSPDAPGQVLVVIAGRSLAPNFDDTGFSVRLPESLRERLSRQPEEHPVWLYDPVAQQRQRIGMLRVEAAVGAKPMVCKVEDWGPSRTPAGQAFNQQPDGSAALWLLADCPDAETVVVVWGEVELPTTFRPEDGLITARVPDPGLYAEPGDVRIRLLEPESGRFEPVGRFRVGD